MQHNVGHWAVAQVCDWSDYIGLGQYRKKFVHHCIDGRLLLKLSDKHLKVLASNTPAGISTWQFIQSCCDSPFTCGGTLVLAP